MYVFQFQGEEAMDNMSVSVNSSFDTISLGMVQVKISLYSGILVWSLIGNILVIAVILRNKHLKTNFNYLIVNMAISDLAIPCLALPLKIVEVNVRPMEWLVDGPFGNLLCKLSYFAADISPAVSAFSLVVIAANRFVAIARPMQRKLSRSGTLKLIAGTWIMSMVLLSPYFYTFRLDATYGWTMCITTWSPAFDDSTAETIFIIIVITVVFVTPCITNTILYSLMLYRLRQNSKNVANMLSNRQFRHRQRKDKNILIMTVVIMFMYLALWGPFFCALFVLSFVVRENSGNTVDVQTVIMIVQMLGYLNTAINPCIYFYFLRDLRRGLKKLLYRNALQEKFKSFQLTSQRSRASTTATSRIKARRTGM